MTKKEIILPITVLGLTLLFACICVAVFLTNGKSAKWVSRKMKIGGLLLSLTAIVQTGCHRNTLCYKFADPIPVIDETKIKRIKAKNDKIIGLLENAFPIYYDIIGFEKLKSEEFDTTEVQKVFKNLITYDKIIKSGPTEFYYEVMNLESNKIILNGTIEPRDGKFDGSDEKFEIRPTKKLRKGKYILKIYYKNLYTLESFDYPDPFKIEIGTKIIKIRK